MVVIVREVAPSENGRRRNFRVGDRYTGILKNVGELEDTIPLIRRGAFPHVLSIAWWTIRRYLPNPANPREFVPVATVSSSRVFHVDEFREQGLALVRRVIDALASGSLTLTASGSDQNYLLSLEDLGDIHHYDEVYHNGRGGYLTMVAHIQ